MEDFYTLLAFTGRCALASLRGRTEPSLQAALAALTAIDQERVDWRDVAVAAELVAWAMLQAGIDHAIEFSRGASHAEAGVAATLLRTAERPPAELAPGWYRCVATASGLCW